MTALAITERPEATERRKAYLKAHTCHECRKVDTDGTRGPPVPVRPQPVEIDVCIPLLSELWKLGLLEWQSPRVWVQLELFGEGI